MEQNNTTTPAPTSGGKGLGIAGLVLGILAAIISFVPCLGVWAILPGVIGLILSAISMKQAGSGPKGMAIAGLICSIIACCLGGYQFYVLKTAGDALQEGFNQFEHSGGMDSLTKAMDQLKQLTDTLNVPHQ
ncbi:MAG: hypothetical protein H0U95_01580 [Bacteroidetes bacterium]|nr:hypothetical protein [Bacteroidota bacterium]